MKAIRLVILFFLCSAVAPAQSLYFPPLSGSAWETVSPSSLGWDEAAIPALYDYLQSTNTKAFLVLKDGRIAIEKYFDTFSRDSLWYWASAGKTMTAALVGIAQQEGFLSIEDRSSKWLGASWTSLPPDKEELITIRHQLTMTSGLDDGTGDKDCTLPSCLVYEADAGARWAYHNAPYTLLDSVIASATKLTLNQWYVTRMRSKIGMNGAYLPSGPYNNVLFTTPRSMARFGLLILNKGVWSSTAILTDTAYIRQMLTPSQQLNRSYGYLWWLNGQPTHMLPETQIVFGGPLNPDAPVDMFAALGKNGQLLNVVPSRNLVFVRMGNDPDERLLVPTNLNNEIWKRLNPVLRFMTDAEQIPVPTTSIALSMHPHPVADRVVFDVELGAPGHGDVAVFDALGRRVATIAAGAFTPGTSRIVFDTAREGLRPGLYFVRLRTQDGNVTRTIVVTR